MLFDIEAGDGKLWKIMETLRCALLTAIVEVSHKQLTFQQFIQIDGTLSFVVDNAKVNLSPILSLLRAN